MKLLVAGIGLLSAVAILQPAVAAELPVKPKRERVAAPERPAPQLQRPAPAPTQTANWTGGQIGGSNGVSSVNNSFVDPGSFICPAGTAFGTSCFEQPFSFSGNKTSYTIGPFVGYRWMVGEGPYPGSVVFGLEGDWSWKRAETSSNLGSSVQMLSGAVLRTDTFSGSIKQGWDASIRARLGTLITPWSMVYLTGGVAFGQISGTVAYNGALFGCMSPCSTTPFATAITQAAWSDTRVGSTVGAGWETEVWAGVKARAEYRYTDFGRYTKTFGLANTCVGLTGTGCLASPSGNVSVDLRESFHTFRVGLAVDLP
jgi:outer membrane immunogenic protein